MQLALESCSLESTGRLLESVSNYRSRWMMISSQELQDPAYRATLLFTHYLFNIHGQLYGNRLCVIVYLQSQFDRESF
jgi:hypothetical protein